MVFRFRYQLQGGHVHVRLYTAKSHKHTFACCGNFAFYPGEWETFKQDILRGVFALGVSTDSAYEFLREDEKG